MTKVILPDNTTNEFVYDGDKRRVSSKNTEGTITRFLYDGVNNLGDYDEDWDLLASYTQGVGIDKLIRRKDSNGVRYYHADALGTTRLMTKPDQSTAASYTYDAWGKIKTQTGEGSNRHKFTGREWDAEINLQYNRARFYDPEIGRFITQDPLTKGPDDPTICYKDNIYAAAHRVIEEFFNSMQPNKLNRYTYCQNNPINFIDPLGLDDMQTDLEDEMNNAGDAADEETGGSKSDRDRNRIKNEIEHSDLSDREKKDLLDKIDDMSVPDFNDFRRDWDRASDSAESRFDRHMTQLERWFGDDAKDSQKALLPGDKLDEGGYDFKKALAAAGVVSQIDSPAIGPADVAAAGLAGYALYHGYKEYQRAIPEFIRDAWTSPYNQDPNKEPRWNSDNLKTIMKWVGFGGAGAAIAIEIYWETFGKEPEEAAVNPNKQSLIPKP